ncbi:60S ribosomal protein L9B, variant 3 [Entomophthora muscae]|uniref:60S ribosomal protein L9B, variant 3 n=2 Tax=Entomophthora muscae TaxID=34485 RepID=A0ACC2UNE6_9FUNG|nr:60S ribosomal protein L9B [Entomophthora muscae]KAJ9088645.1 60S ribosomal protein L9B, variant 3 [Entomophthora muscae]
MKDIYQEDLIVIPDNVKVTFKARTVQVKGPRGVLTKAFQHVDVELQRFSKRKIKVVIWHGNRKHSACLGTITSHIKNMIVGVTKGFLYKMRLVYSHFPINVTISDDGLYCEIRNFLGEKRTRKVDMLEGVTIEHSKDVKDELILYGNDINNVSQSAASIQQSTLARNKDIRKFLDGIYVSQKTNIKMDE